MFCMCVMSVVCVMYVRVCWPSFQDKHTNFDLNTHAPAMLRVPGVTDAGMRTKALTSTTDFFPTLADIALGHTIPSCPRMYNSSDVRFRVSRLWPCTTIMIFIAIPISIVSAWFIFAFSVDFLGATKCLFVNDSNTYFLSWS